MISLRRFREFIKVAFGPHVSIRNWVNILRAGISVSRSSVTHAEWSRRTRICYSCPIFDKARKTCQPFPESEMGCGCYIPYSNLLNKKCWGRERFGGDFGW